MLIVTEVAEAMEDWRVQPPEDWSRTDLKDPHNPEKPVGLAIELIDVLVRVLDLAGHMKIDLEKALEVKSNYNSTRPFRHGGKRG